jgi:hypothetical protein
MRQSQPLPKLVSFIAPLLCFALGIGCTSTSHLPGSDASWSAAGGTTGGHGAGNGGRGGAAGTGGAGAAGAGGAGGHAVGTLDAGIDRRLSASDAGIDRPVTSDAQSCGDGGVFLCFLCSTDDVAKSAVCSGGVWTCPAGLTRQCPPCSFLPPSFGCTCNPSNGAITCPHDAAAVDRPPGQ